MEFKHWKSHYAYPEYCTSALKNDGIKMKYKIGSVNIFIRDVHPANPQIGVLIHKLYTHTYGLQ